MLLNVISVHHSLMLCFFTALMFSHFEVSASKKDLLNHLGFIKMMVDRDKKLSRSQVLPPLLIPLRARIIDVYCPVSGYRRQLSLLWLQSVS